MPAPQVSLAVVSSAATSGTYQVPDADAQTYDQFDFVCTCAGGTVTVVAKQWATSDTTRKADVTDSLAAQTQCTISADLGPYPHLEIAWSSNTGTLTVDLAMKRKPGR